MKSLPNSRVLAALEAYTQVASLGAIGTGLAVLLGWIFGIAMLKSILPGLVTMKANTALAFIGLGVSLWLLRREDAPLLPRRAAQILAGIVLVLGLLTLGEYVFGRNFGIDQLLFKEALSTETSHPGRMSPVTAVLFCLLSLGVLLIEFRGAQYILSGALHLSLLPLVGYLFGAASLYRLAGFTSIALHTAILLFILSLGFLFARPRHAIVNAFLSQLPGGTAMRLMLGTAVAAIILLGWLVEEGEKWGFFDTENDTVVYIALLIPVFSGMIYFSTRLLILAEGRTMLANRLYAMLSQVNQQIVRLRESADLFEAICDIALEFGSFDVAWIGTFGQEVGSIRLEAFRTNRPNLDPAHEFGTAEKQASLVNYLQPVREGHPLICNNLANEATDFPFRQGAEKYGLRTFAFFPLRPAGQAIRVLTVCSEHPALFTPTEIKLLNEVAGDIEFALETMAHEAQRKYAEEALRQSEQRFSILFEKVAYSAVLSRLDDGVIVAVNEAFEQTFGYTRQEVVGKTSLELGLSLSAEARMHSLTLLKQQGFVRDLEIGIQTRSGETRYFSVNANVLELNDAPYFIAASQDITERKRSEEIQRHRLRELEALNTVSAALRTAQTVEEALPILLDQTLLALDAEAGAIWLYHPPTNELHLAAAHGWFRALQEPAIKAGEGIAGKVFSSGRAHHSVEFARDPLAHPSIVEQIPFGWGGACVPILSKTAPVGAMFVSVRLPRQVAPEGLKLLASLAEMAGTTLHRLSLSEETLHRLAHLQALRTIDLAITTSFDMQLTLNILLEQVVSRLSVDAAGVLLLNINFYILEYAAGYGFRTQGYKRSRLHLGEGLAGRAALDRQVLQVSHLTDNEFVRAGLLEGEEFVFYATVPLIAKGQVLGVLEVFRRTPFQPDGEWLNFLEALAAQAAIATDNARLFENLQRSNADLVQAYDATIEGWSRALDLRDKETEGHTQRVTELTVRLARAMGVREGDLIHIRRGALLHDIGKMGVPDHILLKPDKLTDEEWDIMRQHPTFAYEMLRPISFLQPALDIPYCHHEKWDGTGYPHGLHGEQIPLAARLFAVVDVWDALTSDRPYRKGWSQDKVLAYIQAQAGTHFDPKIAELFVQLIREQR